MLLKGISILLGTILATSLAFADGIPLQADPTNTLSIWAPVRLKTDPLTPDTNYLVSCVISNPNADPVRTSIFSSNKDSVITVQGTAYGNKIETLLGSGDNSVTISGIRRANVGVGFVNVNISYPLTTPLTIVDCIATPQ